MAAVIILCTAGLGVLALLGWRVHQSSLPVWAKYVLDAGLMLLAAGMGSLPSILGERR